ncbi:MAG: hypothetical protein JSV62_15935 [Promethearchaeota archaeon]|nr:MAG: hypothetical protein JSV62_15935 [Candidatus Lokiarchaeota archaeon]
MTEIKKLTKISLIIIAIVGFLFGTILTFLYDMAMNPEGWTNPYYPRFFGGVSYLVSIFAIIVLRKKEWEEIKLTFAFLFGLFLPTLIIEIAVTAIFGSTFQPSTVLTFLTTTTPLMAVLLVLGIVTYIKQRS